MSFIATLFLCLAKLDLIDWTFALKTSGEFFGNFFSSEINVSEILSSLALPCFWGTILIVFLSKSVLFHVSFAASPDLIPVSFSSVKNVDVLNPQAAIS